MDSIPKQLAQDYTAAVIAELRGEIAAMETDKKKLSADAGVAYQSLLRYLSGDRQIPIDVLIALCVALDLDVAELWERAEKRIDAIVYARESRESDEG